MVVTVDLPAVLRPYAGGRAEVVLDVPDGCTVRAVLDRLAADAPALERRLRDERGALRQYVNVYLGDDDVRTAGLLDSRVPERARLLVLPSVAGG
ncbi:MAG TPA: MoaD/ThiS family protein [Jiangellales bacterium]|nr:MoaD/ThiS family protein [Jiangellales bacterium]